MNIDYIIELTGEIEALATTDSSLLPYMVRCIAQFRRAIYTSCRLPPVLMLSEGGYPKIWRDV
jgi:hypothetical protein